MFIIYNEAIEKAMREDPYIPIPDALTLTATADNSSVMLNKVGTLSNTFEVDTGNGWTPYNLGTSITRNRGETVKFRCVNHPTTQSATKYIHFEMSGVFEASGDCNSLLSPNYASIRSLNGYSYAFYKLFLDCGSLTTAPKLPATTLEVGCYGAMFSGCTALVQAPTLPATTLARNCYYVMFQGCTALTQVPSLPAMELEEGCYGFMFTGCVSLTQAPTLPATTLAKDCYRRMFSGCTALTQVPSLPAMELKRGCYESMFEGCVSLTQAPSALPAIDAPPRCYFGMFEGCTSLINAPTIAATTCRKGSDKYDNAHFSHMFRNCTALANPPEIHLTTLAYHALYFMFSGCTSIIRAPRLPAMTLEEGCYYGMFSGCSSLTEASIAATTTATDALTDWLDGVAASGTVYADPSLTLPTDSASGIPSGWARHDIASFSTIE